MGSILYMNELPPDGGGDTLFANMYRAYETLSPPMQEALRGADGGARRRARSIAAASAARRRPTRAFRAASIRWCAPIR